MIISWLYQLRLLQCRDSISKYRSAGDLPAFFGRLQFHSPHSGVINYQVRHNRYSRQSTAVHPDLPKYWDKCSLLAPAGTNRPKHPLLSRSWEYRTHMELHGCGYLCRSPLEKVFSPLRERGYLMRTGEPDCNHL